MADLEAIRARRDAATPGPWRWFDQGDGAYLATPDRGRLFILRCFRKGSRYAEPRFRREHVMVPGVDHPDAEFIAHARQDVDDLLDLVDDLLKLGNAVEEDREAGLTWHVLELLDGLVADGLLESGPGRCARCSCTDYRACDPPCRWVDPRHRLCSACSPAGIEVADE